jgi:predicted acyltransferase
MIANPNDTQTGPAATPPMRPATASVRLASLDVLRGFDMFWIVGGGGLLTALLALLATFGYNRPTEWIAPQMHHVPWAGLAAWDLIFPVFVFISGATMPFAITSRLERGEKKRTIYWRLFRRMAFLLFFGATFGGLLDLNFANARYLSVLGLIGAAYFIAGVVVVNRGVRGQIAWAVGLLVGYWAAMNYIPVPGIGPGVITPGGCLTGYIDSHLMPGRLHAGVFDPEGTLCYLPAAAAALIGALAGRLLRAYPQSPYRNVAILLACGFALVGLGFAWNPYFPIIKAIWSSSFILAACGIGMILLGLFYMVIDVWRCRWLGFFFIPIGMNAITIYLGFNYFIDFHYTSNRIFGGIIRLTGQRYGSLASVVAVLAVEWALLYFLYRKKIFLRV